MHGISFFKNSTHQALIPPEHLVDGFWWHGTQVKVKDVEIFKLSVMTSYYLDLNEIYVVSPSRNLIIFQIQTNLVTRVNIKIKNCMDHED